MSLFLLRAARLEALEAEEWYGVESEILALRFRTDLAATLRLVESSPQLFQPVAVGYRRAQLNVYPYSVIFHQTHTAIEVVAIAHASRHPSYWRSHTVGKYGANQHLGANNISRRHTA